MAKSVDFGRSVFLASDEMQDSYCAPCNKDGNFVLAEGFCVDCTEYLCGQCYKSHRRFKSMENHVLKDKDSLSVPVGSSREITDECVEKCVNHPSKVVEFFCGTCDFLGCYACITVHHRQCEKVVHIPDIVQESGTIKEFTDFHKELEFIAKRLADQDKKIQDNIETNLNMKKLAKDELKTQRAEINKFFDDLEKKMDIQIENIEQENKRVLKVASDRLKSMEKSFDEMKTSVELKKNGQNCELFIAMKKSKKVIETLNDGFDKLVDERRITRYSVLPSEQIQAMIKTTTEICRLTTARLQIKIDISTTNDKVKPRIRGLTTVHGHYYVVSENGKTSLKVIDTRRNCVTSEIHVNARTLRGLTFIHDDQVAVSVYLPQQKIQFFSVSASGVITSTGKQFDVKGLCIDLAYNNDKLVLCQKSQILICNIAGQTLNKIEHNSADVPMFTLKGIVLSQDGETIYVTDEANNAVISMTLNGCVKAIYKDKDIKDPRGITVDKRGYVYVCSLNTNTIHQLTADLSRAQIIIDDVYGTCVSSGAENKLYVGESGCVCVYDLNH